MSGKHDFRKSAVLRAMTSSTNICSEKPFRSSALMRALSHNDYVVKRNRNHYYVTSGLILRTVGAFIMDMEYANDSSHSSISEAQELNILVPSLVMPYQFETPASSCLHNTADC